MLSRQTLVAVGGLAIAAAVLTGALPIASFGANRAEVVFDPAIEGLPAAASGVWRTRTQLVFDPANKTLLRRSYTVWDPAPSRDLEFEWIPDSFALDREGKINGTGRLVWRLKGKPGYDRASIFAEYRGMMVDGRADGQGSYFDTTGISYKGAWNNGLMDGFGTLTLADDGEYIGQMHAGKANGPGEYIDVTGEIFKGNFVDGERDGTGTTTLPNGHVYQSHWLAGKESEESRRVRVAQSTGLPQLGGTDDVRIGITIDKSKARDSDLTYAEFSNGPRLIIQPDNPRLVQMWKGNGQIQLTESEEGGLGQYGVFSLNKGQLLPLTLIFQVENRSPAPIAVVGAYLAVAKSVTDLEPAIQLNRALEVCSLNPFKPTFVAENFGWGAAQDAEMHFAFTNPNASARPSGLNVSKRVGTIARVSNIDLGPELRSAGVNTGVLAARSKSGFICSGGSPAACMLQIKASGIFGSISPQVGLIDTSIFVDVNGVLNYNWVDGGGASHTRSSPYIVKLPLGHIKIEAECGEGGQPDVIAARALEFQLDRSDYRLPIAFNRSLPAGQTSQFKVTVHAAKSSQHQFTVVLQLADGREISSRPISLLYYVPSWFSAS